MRQLIVYAAWINIVLSALGLISMLRQSFPAPPRRQAYWGQRISAIATILLGLALTQFNALTWFSWVCLGVGGVLSLISVGMRLRRRGQ